MVGREDQVISFEAQVKPLFRALDQKSMSSVFDLWSYEDVSRHADAILDRLQAGTMPCDGAWPRARLTSSVAGWRRASSPEGRPQSGPAWSGGRPCTWARVSLSAIPPPRAAMAPTGMETSFWPQRWPS